jgi:hypothetical protein
MSASIYIEWHSHRDRVCDCNTYNELVTIQYELLESKGETKQKWQDNVWKKMVYVNNLNLENLW